MTSADYKATRSRLGTQAEVAALLGVARGTVARRETGKLTITHEAALALDALSSAPQKKRPARGKRAAMRASNEVRPINQKRVDSAFNPVQSP
jgi:hypothetical protein